MKIFRIFSLNQFIYVVGGFDGTRQLASVERYDTENQIWDSVASIKIARSALSLTVLDGKLYAMGGFDGHTFLNIVEFYDPNHDKWEDSTPLTSGRSGHASAVIYQPSCANQYMECMEDQVDRGGKPADDDENKPGPSNPGGPSTKGPTQTPNSTSQLHAFSGSRCTHCDDVNKDETNHEHKQKMMTKNGGQCSENQSKYEQECRDAIRTLLEMDNDEKCKEVESIHQHRIKSDPDPNDDCMDISAESEISDCEIDNPKKMRRKYSSPDDYEMDEHKSNLDMYPSNNIPEVKARLKGRTCESGQCSLTKLKNRVRQNISDFVTWSSQSVTPLPKSVSQDSNSNTSHLTNTPIKSTSREERKCDLLRKYYKCKFKNCNTSK